MNSVILISTLNNEEHKNHFVCFVLLSSIKKIYKIIVGMNKKTAG